MNGARWGWIAFIGAIAVLFTASSYDQSSNNKAATLLRQELKTTLADRDQLRDEQQQILAQAQEATLCAEQLDQEVQNAYAQVKALRAERDKLRKELTSLSQDRNQLQQTIASLQVERSQTKRNVEQLRQGLHQLLSQADSVAAVLATPAPGFAQITYDEPLMLIPIKACPQEAGTYYPDEPLNNNK